MTNYLLNALIYWSSHFFVARFFKLVVFCLVARSLDLVDSVTMTRLLILSFFTFRWLA